MAHSDLPPRYALLSLTTVSGAVLDCDASPLLWQFFPINEHKANVEVIDPTVPWTRHNRPGKVIRGWTGPIKLAEVRYQIEHNGKVARFNHPFKASPGTHLTAEGIQSAGKLFISYRLDEIFRKIKTRSTIKVVQFVN